MQLIFQWLTSLQENQYRQTRWFYSYTRLNYIQSCDLVINKRCKYFLRQKHGSDKINNPFK